MRRRIVGGLFAVGVAAMAVVVTQVSSRCALCVIYTPDDPAWYFFLCYLCDLAS